MESQGASILVVDDTEMNRVLLSRRLVRQGYRVAVAEHGRQALEMIEGEPFDLVLLDIMMPEMNGFEVLERLKADERLRHLPVIVISAVTDMESIVRCIEMGAEDHLPKPFDPVLLKARISASLERKRLRDRERLYAQSLERELEIGRQIQAGFLPEELPQAAGWEIAACFRPARQVAGDFYDAFPLGSDGKIAVLIADVCDKGVGAALFMALFRSLLRAVAVQRFTGGADLASSLRATLEAVNDYVATTHSRANMFATLFFGVLDPAAGSLVYVNAGHEAPVLLGPGGDRERLAPTGPAVGLLPGMEFRTRETVISSGCMLLAFTDGVTDALGADGTPFTEERLLSLLAEPVPSAAGMLSRIEEEIGAYTQDAAPFDDITMLAVRRGERV